MAHEIEATDQMFSARQTPWHGLGVVTAEALTAEEALTTAGLDWTVVQRPLYLPGRDDEVTEVQAPGWFATFREMPGNGEDHFLGVVGDDYEVIQNTELFDFMDSLVDAEGVTYETAGSLRDSKIVWMLAKLPREVSVAGDDVIPYVLMMSSHDRSMAMQVSATPVRVVCMNTLRLALDSTPASWKAKHTRNALTKLDEARRALKLSYGYLDEFEAEVERLIETQVTNDRFEEIVMGALPHHEAPEGKERSSAETKRDADRDRLRTLWYTSPTIEGFRETGWGLVNTFSEWEEWTKPVKGADDGDTAARWQRNANRQARQAQLTPVTSRIHKMLVAAR